MITGSYQLWERNEYSYADAIEFIPNIHYYLHDEDARKRPGMIVVPGGGYGLLAPSEGENVALCFFEKGYNAFVLTYTTNKTNREPLGFRPLKDLARAVAVIREHTKTWHVDADQLVACGFSAGAHLVGSLAVHYDDPDIFNLTSVSQSYRPDAVILSYPVITSGKYAHMRTFDKLIGADATEQQRDYFSIEKHVNENTPPCFIWQTVEDDAVPVQNSYLMAEACLKKHVPFEHHVFAHGLHGMSLADEALENDQYSGNYVVDQSVDLLEHAMKQEAKLPELYEQLGISSMKDPKEMVLASMKVISGQKHADASVAMWPELADRWIKSQFEKKG